MNRRHYGLSLAAVFLFFLLLMSPDMVHAQEDTEVQWVLDTLEQIEAKPQEETFVYNGSAIEPAVTLIYTDEEGSQDVTALFITNTVYSSNQNAGTGCVAVHISGFYQEGQPVYFENEVIKETTFTIQSKKINDAVISLQFDTCTYNGTARKPAPTVTVDLASGQTILKKNSAYKVTYNNNQNAGTAKVTITGIGNYTGTVTKKFSIQKKSLENAKITLSTVSYTYNGKDKKPSPTAVVKLGSTKTTLKKNRDYTVAYSKNISSIGQKTVKITGTGNYKGSAKAVYQILPEVPSKLKVSARTTGSLSITCKTARDESCKYNFSLYTYDSASKKWMLTKTATVSQNEAVFSDLKPATEYRIKAALSKKSSGTVYSSKNSETLRAVTTPARTTMVSAAKTASGSLKAVWKATETGSGYQIAYSTKSNFSGSKSILINGRSSTSAEVKGLSGSTWFVKVRAYKTLNDKKYYGEWSSASATSYSNLYASYSTTFNAGNYNRTTNLKLACAAINGTILLPGDIFNFNDIVGERTAAKGYKEAIVYEAGQETGGIGGGICQVATTLFNTALRANCGIVERHQHSLTVHYCPLGYDAAIAWGSKNLRFTNNTSSPMKVEMTISGSTMTCRLLTAVPLSKPNVTTSVTVHNGVYTLRRYLDGRCNYVTTSDYLDN